MKWRANDKTLLISGYGRFARGWSRLKISFATAWRCRGTRQPGPLPPSAGCGLRAAGSIFPYRNGYAAYVWVTPPGGTPKRKWVYGKTREEVHGKWIKLQERASQGPAPTTTPTVASYLAYWLAEVIEPNREPNTYSHYELMSRLTRTRPAGCVRFASDGCAYQRDQRDRTQIGRKSVERSDANQAGGGGRALLRLAASPPTAVLGCCTSRHRGRSATGHGR